MRAAWFPSAAIMMIAAPTIAGSFYRGYAYTVDDHRLLYTESHWLYEDKGIGHRLVIYSCPDGQAFARKWVDTSQGASTPDVDMLDARWGYREGVRTHDGQREVYSQPNSASPEKHAPITTPRNAVIDAGFDAFVRDHWNDLSSAGVAPLPFLVPSQMRYVDFSAKKLRDESNDGRELRWFRLQLDGWYAFALPHIDVAYDTQDHALSEYRGLSNIRGNGNRNLDVTIEFPPAERRSDIGMPDVERAGAMPLTGRCAS
jgi:hypothetical protein